LPVGPLMSALLPDTDKLLAPLPGPDPVGGNPILFSGKLRDLRKEAVEEGAALPVTDPARVGLWRGVLKFTQGVLADQSKSLEAAARLVEALTRVHGFAGARDGFALLRRFVEEAWDRVWPKIDPPEEGEPPDLSRRASLFDWLDDPEGSALFPNTLREAVIAEAGGVEISAAKCRAPAGKAAAVAPEQLREAAFALGAEKARAAREEVAATLAEWDLLAQAVEAKFEPVPDQTPSFRNVRIALDECLQVADELAYAAGGDAQSGTADEADATASANGDAAAAGTAGADGAVSRQALYRQLAQIADKLARVEPHSPVPLLIRRLVELEGLPFPELVRQLNRADERVLEFLERPVVASGPVPRPTE
jgi:type VI secretion system protein ImpA